MIKKLIIAGAVLLWAALGVLLAGNRHHRAFAEVTPRRIVSLAPNLTEILYALDLNDEIVAVSSDSDWPPAATQKPAVGTFWRPNIEAVIAARPELVVTLGSSQQKSLAHRLNRMGYKTLTLNIEKLRDLFEAMALIGTATGRQSQARLLAADIQKKLDDLSAPTGISDAVRVLYVVQREPLRVAGRDTFVNEIIELAGGENTIGPTLHKYPPIGTELVIACGPDVIIESGMDRDNIAKQRRAAQLFWSKWPNLPAVKNNRIYVIESDTVLRLGPRLPQGVGMIARCLRTEPQ